MRKLQISACVQSLGASHTSLVTLGPCGMCPLHSGIKAALGASGSSLPNGSNTKLMMFLDGWLEKVTQGLAQRRYKLYLWWLKLSPAGPQDLTFTAHLLLPSDLCPTFPLKFFFLVYLLTHARPKGITCHHGNPNDPSSDQDCPVAQTTQVSWSWIPDLGLWAW